MAIGRANGRKADVYKKGRTAMQAALFLPQVKQSTPSILSQTFLIGICFPSHPPFSKCLLLSKSHWKD